MQNFLSNLKYGAFKNGEIACEAVAICPKTNASGGFAFDFSLKLHLCIVASHLRMNENHICFILQDVL
jgi:hypothetical protein